MIENRRKSKLSAVVLAAMLAGSAGGYAYAADMPVKVKAPPPPKPVPFFFVNDTSVSATWYFNSTDPGVSGGSNIVPGGIAGERNTFYRAQGSVDHFDVWEYGTNLIHLELDQYSKKDPILGEPGAVGSREFFGFTRSTIGFNELTHSKVFSNFLFNDVGFEGGFTAGVQNNYLSEQTTQYLVGLNFDVAIPKQLGTLLVGVLARKEFTHNQFNACGPAGFGDAQSPAAGFGGGTCIGGASFSGDRDFKWDWNVEIFDAIPLGGIIGSWADPLRIIDITNIRGPKGTGISTANCLAIGCFGRGWRLQQQRNQDRSVRGRSSEPRCVEGLLDQAWNLGCLRRLSLLVQQVRHQPQRSPVLDPCSRHVDRKHGLCGDDLSLQIVALSNCHQS